jgi:hypothetical protein
MKTLTLTWQRLLDARGGTCPRCRETGDEVAAAAKTLAKALRPLGIALRTERKALSPAAFRRLPSSSNRIWVGGRPLEDWLGATTGESRCCGSCGDARCRTVELGGASHAAVPARLVVGAGLMAAGRLLAGAKR